ncbi:MAG: hypothetical protein COB98_02615 [Flavobacteriaceae bacterium]|nr:MAG: hypothetical protein COB98_02615 [Flavobacteriaceae bacterium]
MEQEYLRIPSFAGRFNVAKLKRIMAIAIRVGIQDVFVGNRQELILPLPKDLVHLVTEKLEEEGIEVVHRKNRFLENHVITSLPSLHVFSSKKWIHTGTYTSIYKQMKKYSPLKIGIVDGTQHLTPVLMNQLNFIASDFVDYWYLYICFDAKDSPFLWPVLIDSKYIAMLIQEIENYYEKLEGIVLNDELVEFINTKIRYNYKGFSKIPKLPTQEMPCYDVFTKYSEKYWLGITCKENKFSSPLVDHLTTLCKEQDISNIYVTTWGSLLIRSILQVNKLSWNSFLGNYNIITGHAYYELNWIMQGSIPRFQYYKDKMINYFYQNKIRCMGITLGFFYGEQDAFPLIAIKIVPVSKLLKIDYFEIYIPKDSQLNNRSYRLHSRRLSFIELKRNILDIIDAFQKKHSIALPEKVKGNTMVTEQLVHQCTVCFTLYEHKGQPTEGFELIAFSKLPDSYCCSVCGGAKEKYKNIPVSLLGT